MESVRLLVVDHDDTAVVSTPLIHYPAYVETLKRLRPGDPVRSLEGFYLANFDPGFSRHLREELAMSDEEIQIEFEVWREHVRRSVPPFYAGFAELLRTYRAQGGLVAVVSHSEEHTIRRDYAAGAGGFVPDAIFGWDEDEGRRKPSPYPLSTLLARYRLAPRQLLVLDDLKPGMDMAARVGARTAAAGWAHRIPAIERGMRSLCDVYLETVGELAALLGLGVDQTDP